MRSRRAAQEAYTKIETDARAQLNPSGYPTKAQRQEAKEAAIIRAEAEAADGRFRRMSHYPVLWDGQSNVLYAGMTSLTAIERLKPCSARRSTARSSRSRREAGLLASRSARPRAFGRGLRAGRVRRGGGYSTVAWADSDASSRDFWGNEFLIWLWHTLQIDGDTIKLPDRLGSDRRRWPRPDAGLPARRAWAATPDHGRADQAARGVPGDSGWATPRARGLIIVRHAVLV